MNMQPPQQPLHSHHMSFFKRYQWAVVVLLLTSLLLYGYSISFSEYVLDDIMVLAENNFVKKGISGIIDIFSHDTFTGFLGSQQVLVYGARYRPLSLATFALEYEWLGLNPHVSHFINILLYGITAVLMMKVFSDLLPDNHRQSIWWQVPFLCSFFFLLHPIHTEVVANIKSRDELLCLFFSLFSLYWSYKARTKIFGYEAVGVGTCFLLGLLAKENAITFLAIIPLTHHFFFKASLREKIYTLWPLAVATVLYLLLRYYALGFLLHNGKDIPLLMNNPFLHATSEQKFATIFYTLLLYVKLLIFPHPLTHDYYPYHIPLISWSDWRAIASLLLHASMIIYIVKKFSKKTIPVFSISYYLITLSVVSNLFMPVGVFMAERFLYMPSVGFCLLLAHTVVTAESHFKQKHRPVIKYALHALTLIMAVAYAGKTICRVPDWKDTYSLNRSGALVSKNSARAQQYFGYTLYQMATKETERTKKLTLYHEALSYVNKALTIYPGYSDALTTKAGIYAGLYQLDGNLDTLLQIFYNIQLTQPVAFVDQYLNYLDTRVDRNKLKNFYTALGHSLKQRGNTTKAKYYLEKAAQMP